MNEVVVHGIPRKDVVLKTGDIIGIDFGCFIEGYCGDSARTLRRQGSREAAQKLVERDQESLEHAIEQCSPGIGSRTSAGRCSRTSSRSATRWCAPSLGTASVAPCTKIRRSRTTASPGRGLRLKPGLVLAIEPMVNAGQPEVEVLADRWTAVTKDRSLSAHFEHSVAITEERSRWCSGPRPEPSVTDFACESVVGAV